MHIAVVASSAPSHMHPHLAVVAELVRRGHRVTYLVGSHLAALARPTGADVVGYDSLLPGSPERAGQLARRRHRGHADVPRRLNSRPAAGAGRAG